MHHGTPHDVIVYDIFLLPVSKWLARGSRWGRACRFYHRVTTTCIRTSEHFSSIWGRKEYQKYWLKIWIKWMVYPYENTLNWKPRIFSPCGKKLTKVCDRQQKDRWMDGQMDRQTDSKQTDGWTDRWTDEQMDEHTGRQTHSIAIYLLTGRQTDERIHRQTVKWTDRQIDGQTEPLVEWFLQEVNFNDTFASGFITQLPAASLFSTYLW